MDLKQVEELIGTEASLVARVAGLKSDIETLKFYGDSKSIMICAHNTILAIKMFGKISHVVDTNEERNLKMISDIDAHLSVPRYSPKTAKAWLKEDTEFGSASDGLTEVPEKVLLSERELREIVIKDKEQTIEALNRSLAYYASVA